MQNFEFQELSIKGAYLIKPFFSGDNRGGFIKDYNCDVFIKNGLRHELKETFYTISKKGVIRALHFQRVIQQPKLVRCIHGSIFDVIVDLRRESATFGRWVSFELTHKNMLEVMIPAGCAHGYLVLEDSIVSYKCGEVFFSEYDTGIKFDDPSIDVKWPYDLIGGKKNIIISEKDKNLVSFKTFVENYDFYSKGDGDHE